MGFEIHNNTAVVFDLDDTLYKEIDFLKSAYREIAHVLNPQNWKEIFEEMMWLYTTGAEVFGNIIAKYHIHTQTKENLMLLYHNHVPDIQPIEHATETLDELKDKDVPLGLITDGRSITQRNKIESLGIKDYFGEILISEEFGSTKPDQKNFKHMQDALSAEEYVYVADNVDKDFIAPNCLGWVTICLVDNGENIHPQQYSQLEERLQKPNFFIHDFSEIKVAS